MAKDDCELRTLSCDPTSFWAYSSICLGLITTAGTMAGLTMGLLSLDKLNMRILEMEGSEIQKQRASKVLPVISQHHFLLVTLLLVNAAANEALPIFLDKLVPEEVSIALSVTFVLLFVDILPTAIFTGPNQLQIAAALAPLARGLMVLVSPIAFPISKILDCVLGDDHEIAGYKRKELKALIALQRENDAAKRVYLSRQSESMRQLQTPSQGQSHSPSDTASTYWDSSRETILQAEQSTRLHVDEVTIIHGALDLSAKDLSHIMIPMEHVYMLEYDTKLNHNVLAEVLAAGHSRIPVYKDHRANVVGLLLVKRLIVVDPDDERPVRDLCLRKPIVASPHESEQAEKVMGCWENGEDIPVDVEFVGIVTIEDVIEALIQENIEDESDKYVHDIVECWCCRNRRLRGVGGFVRTRLKALAELARRRVQDRRKAAIGCLPSKELEADVRVKIVNESTPLMQKF